MSDRLLISTRKGLFTIERGAAGWRIAGVDFLGDNVTLAYLDQRSGFRYAALDHGHFGVKLHRNEGDGWREVGVPVYPPMPEGYEELDFWGRALKWSLARIWAFAAGGESEPGVLWCGTMPGGLFRSADHGDSWHLVEALWHHPLRRKWMPGGADLPGLHSICVDPRDPRQLSIAVSTGGVWHSADGGASWELRGQGLRAEYVPEELIHNPLNQDVHLLAQCRAAPERMWVQHHNGIFVSSDEGRTFTEVSANARPAAFGFPVAVHPHDPDTAWFVPGIKDEKRCPVDGRLVVSRTRDGGATFEVLTEGLPQAHAYDVVYRHALAIDDSGARLAFGSTTGNLWVSETGGERWSNISHTLPPVYAVTFA
jgi:hypothetical protein